MRSAIVLLLLFAIACDPPLEQPARWTVWVSPGAPPPVRASAEDVAAYLEAMGRTVEVSEDTPPTLCISGEGNAVVAADPIAGEGVTDQSWRIDETRCDSAGSLVILSGGGLLGRQYAAYEWLHRLGVRFFHPEEEYVPEEPRWPEEALAITHTPAFRWRSVSLHLTHPLELGDGFSLGEEDAIDDALRYIDWQIKNGASRGAGGVGSGEHAFHGIDRGFPLTAGFGLHNQQQGGRPLIDPDDPRPVNDQIAAAIEAQMNRADGRVPDVFGFTFNPSEFTELPDTQIVSEITFIADYLGEHYPDTLVETINHGTHGEPTATYGLRFYDLPELAPPNLGVKVHTLMFYDLFRPAPVYGNESFEFLYDFMARNHTTRPLTYFPEAAWWLTFDIAVPLYLPITIEARDRDIQSIAWMLEGTLDGHHVFGTGHEWGYWQNEYCSYRMAADLSYRYTDCIADITGTMGDAAPDVQAVFEEAIALQERDIIYGNILAYLVGTDPDTEVAASVGVVFHPLPPAPASILRWDAARVSAWLNREMRELERMDADSAALVERLNAIEPMVAERGLPWFREIRDGIEVNGLRARHAWQVYGALVTLRQSQLESDATMRTEAQDLLDAAKLTTQAALEVIARREADYRYPLERSIAGGADGSEDTNWTIYRYRYLNRTHHAYFYTRIDALAEEAFQGGAEPLTVSDALLAPDVPLVVTAVDPSLAGVSVDWGDGSPVETEGPTFTHAYSQGDAYPLAITAQLGAEPFALSGEIGALTDEEHTGFTGRVVEPAGVDLIEPVMPALVFGPIDASRVAVGFSALDDGSVQLGAWSSVASAAGSSARIETVPTRIDVPIVDRATGAIRTRIIVHDAVLSVADDTAPAVLTGALDTQGVIDAVVQIGGGGFDEQGARSIVASTLGYTVDTLPERVAFRIEYDVQP
jgi:hypothetical protein